MFSSVARGVHGKKEEKLELCCTRKGGGNDFALNDRGGALKKRSG